MTPLEQATGILGEHFKNYVVIVQPEEDPSFFDVVHSDPFATTGLLLESIKWHQATMNAGSEDDFDWGEEEEDEEDEQDFWKE